MKRRLISFDPICTDSVTFSSKWKTFFFNERQRLYGKNTASSVLILRAER